MKTHNLPLKCISLCGVLLSAQLAGATILTVINLNDSGPGSLRAAISTSGAGDTIDFTNTLTGTILLASSLPVIGTNLTIINTNVQSVTIWGNGHTTFNIGGGSVTLSGLVIRNGASPGNISSSGTVTINDCVIADAFGSAGIFNFFGSMAINRCLIANNLGGIYNKGTSLIINGSTISDNNAGTAGNSGGIYNITSLSMTNCTVSRNSCSPSSGGSGGGIGGGGTLTLNSCTISSNSAAGGAGRGGGIFGSGVVLVNTLVAGNTATGSGPDVYGAVTSHGYNLIGVTNNSSGWIASDLTGSIITPIDPKLGPLQDNDGPTFTHALLPASLAIDAGNSFALTLDQRGRQRPYDLSYRTNATGGDGSDIGAFELNPPILSIAQSDTNAVLSWSTNDSGYKLQSTATLNPPAWTTLPGTPAIVSQQYTVTNGPIAGAKFYRLATPACAPASSGLVNWWAGESNANDFISANNGTLQNGATFAAGKVGTAFSFDGVDDRVAVPGYGTSIPKTEITVEFWQKVSAVSNQSTFSWNTFISTNVFNAHVPYGDGKVYWDFGNIGTSGRLSYTPPVSIVGTWQHFAMTASQSGNYMRIYRNGVLEASKAGMTPMPGGNLDLLIGGLNVVPFGGLIDEISIYNRALSATEIADIYNAGSLGKCR